MEMIKVIAKELAADQEVIQREGCEKRKVRNLWGSFEILMQYSWKTMLLKVTVHKSR